MKVYVVSKKALAAGLIVFAVLLLAVILTVVLTKPEGGGESSGRDAQVNAHPDDDPSIGTSANIVEEYELEVFPGLMKELPVYSVRRSDKRIALTIDAAWQDDKTEFILSTLSEYDIPATFFLCGFWVKEHPEQVKAIAQAGHEIGNHSMTHPHMSKLSSSAIKAELDEFEKAIEPLIGRRTKLFRAPYGEYNDNVINTLRENGYEVIQWNIDTIDWKEERTSEQILDSVLPRLADGSIILCHNNGYRIEQYLPVLIRTALERGYEFVTVSELLLAGDTVIDVNGVQKALD
ncbi:MAG: polysaccharide deacetylase family protein [Clostridia bacterium]|nr:polysaccharide deacetylase family protein [Clostridia bacterium]